MIADGVVEVFKKQFGDSWGPRLQYILTNTVATVMEAQGTTSCCYSDVNRQELQEIHIKTGK